MTQDTTTRMSGGGDEGQQQGTLLGKLFGKSGTTVTKAKMGLDMEMYYNEELKCWVMPGEEEEKRQQMRGLGGPPPGASHHPTTTAAAASSENGGRRMTRSTSRYAAMPTLRVGQPMNASQGSGILAGLKPPPLSGHGGPQFDSMSVFKPPPSSSPEVEHQTNTEGGQVSQSLIDDPLVLEVLSFWSYYRGCGYGVEVMKEWVRDNYDEDVCLQLDFEEMLMEETVSRAVEEYIEKNRQDGGGHVMEQEEVNQYGDVLDVPVSGEEGGEENSDTYRVTSNDVYSPVRDEEGAGQQHDYGRYYEEETTVVQSPMQEQSGTVDAGHHAYRTYSVTYDENEDGENHDESAMVVEGDLNSAVQDHSGAPFHDHVDSRQETETGEHPADPNEEYRMKHIPSRAMDAAEIGCQHDDGLNVPSATMTPATDTRAPAMDVENIVDEKLKQANGIIEEKESTISQLQSSLETLQEERNSERARLEQDIESARAEIDTLHAELRGQVSASKEAEDALERSNETILRLEGEIESLKSHLQEMESIAESAQQLSEATQEIEELQKNMESLADENSKLAAQAAELSEQLRQIQEERDTAESQRLELLEAQSRAEEEFQATLDERDAEIMQLEARVTLSEKAAQGAYEKAKEELSEAVQELEMLVEEKDTELQEINEKLAEQERKFAVAKKKIQSQSTQIDKLMADCESLQQQVEDSNEYAETARMEKDAIKQQIDQLEQDLERSEEAHTREIAAMVDTFREKESAMKDQLAHWEGAASAAQDALLQEKADKDLAQARVVESEHQISKISEQLIEATSRIKDAEQLKCGMQEQYEEMQQNLQAQCDDYATRLQAANATIEKSQGEIEDLTALLQQYEAQGSTEDLESEVASLRHQLASLSGSMSQKEEELRKYKLQLVKAKKLRASDQERIDELEEQKREYEEKMHHMSADESLDEALVALGQEEAKVLRLVELLRIAGLEDDEIDAELESVELQVGYGGESVL